MRPHLLHIAARLLPPLALAGCQETPTDSQDGRTASQTNVSPMMSSSSSAAPAEKPVVHFVTKGDGASVFWISEPDASGNTIIVQVGIDQLTNPEFDAFSYSVLRCDVSFNCTELEGGVTATAPAGVLTRHGGGVKIKGLKLSINTSAADFCCRTSGEGGLISVEWVRTPGLESVHTGHSKITIGTITELSHGTSTIYSATATGTVVGFPIPSSAFAELESENNRFVEVFHRDKGQAP